MQSNLIQNCQDGLLKKCQNQMKECLLRNQHLQATNLQHIDTIRELQADKQVTYQQNQDNIRQLQAEKQEMNS